MNTQSENRWFGPESVVGACCSLALVVSATTYLLALTVFLALPVVAAGAAGLFIAGAIRRFAVGLLVGLTSALAFLIPLFAFSAVG